MADGNVLKDIGDVMKQLEKASSSDSDDDKEKQHSFQTHMAKLNDLFNKTSIVAQHHTFENVKSRALNQAKYQAKALKIVSENCEDKPAVFPYLALPAELRLLVLSELLVTDDRLLLTWRGPKKAEKRQKKMYPAILRACITCQDEGSSVLYGQNIFDLEEIRRRPLFSKNPLASIGPKNTSKIRIVVAEHSAASEELSVIKPETAASHQFTMSYVSAFLSSMDVKLSQLRIFAVSLVPYGFDDATIDILRLKALTFANNMPGRVAYIEKMNEEKSLKEIVDAICKRDAALKKMDFWADVQPKMHFDWTPNTAGRLWIGMDKHKLNT